VLTVGKVGPANAGYYQSAVVAGMEDYYAGEGEAPGRWVGRADLMGAVAGSLATAVDAGLLLEAKCAPDGTKLGKTTVTAFDLTFSAPKSVSVLYALGNPDVVAASRRRTPLRWCRRLRRCHLGSRTPEPVKPVQRWSTRRGCSGSGIGIATVGHSIRSCMITFLSQTQFAQSRMVSGEPLTPAVSTAKRKQPESSIRPICVPG